MLRIEKQKTEEREITTIGLDIKMPKLQQGAAIGAVVGFFTAGLPGVIIGGIIGGVTQAVSETQK